MAVKWKKLNTLIRKAVCCCAKTSVAVYCCVACMHIFESHTNHWFIIHTYATRGGGGSIGISRRQQQNTTTNVYGGYGDERVKTPSLPFFSLVIFIFHCSIQRSFIHFHSPRYYMCIYVCVWMFMCWVGCHFSSISSGLLNEKFNFSIVCVMKILVLLLWLLEYNRKFKHAIWLYFWWQRIRRSRRRRRICCGIKEINIPAGNAFFRKLIRHSFEILRTRNLPFVAREVVQSDIFFFFAVRSFHSFFLSFVHVFFFFL